MDNDEKRETMIMWESTKSRALKKMGDFKRQGLPINSQDDLVNFLLDNLKTPQESIKDLLIPLKQHLIELNEVETYLKIEAILRPITDDPILVDLIIHYKTVAKVRGDLGVSDKDFQKMCKNLKIQPSMVPYYKKKVLEEIE